MSFSPDGKQLASASLDNTVRLWDLAGGKCHAVWTGYSSRAWVSYHTSGKLLHADDGNQVMERADWESPWQQRLPPKPEKLPHLRATLVLYKHQSLPLTVGEGETGKVEVWLKVENVVPAPAYWIRVRAQEPVAEDFSLHAGYNWSRLDPGEKTYIPVVISHLHFLGRYKNPDLPPLAEKKVSLSLQVTSVYTQDQPVVVVVPVTTIFPQPQVERIALLPDQQGNGVVVRVNLQNQGKQATESLQVSLAFQEGEKLIIAPETKRIEEPLLPQAISEDCVFSVPASMQKKPRLEVVVTIAGKWPTHRWLEQRRVSSDDK